MRTLLFLFVLGASVGVRMGFGQEHTSCVNDGLFPCVSVPKGKTTKSIADAALAVMNERQAAIDKDAEDAVQQGWAKKYKAKDGTVTYHPYGDSCKRFVQLMVFPQLGGGGLGSYYRDAYCKCGYEIDASQADRGDIIQVSHDLKHESHDEWIRLHTAVVLDNLGGGWFKVIDSNYVAGFAIGTHNWDPQPWAKRMPSAYDEFHIVDPIKRKEAQDRWENEEKVNWNAHFYRLAPLPVAGATPPPVPPPTPSPVTLVGKFAPNTQADPRVSAAFREAYSSYTDSATGFNKLGAPDPDVYIPYVTEYLQSGIYLQQFHQPDPAKDRFMGGPAGTDGWTRLVYGKTTGRAYVVSPIFLSTWLPLDFGAPLNNQHIWTGPSDLILPGGYNIYIRQDFALGKTMIAQAVAAGLPYEVRVIDTPSGPIHISVVEGDLGAGFWPDPLALFGWAVSNRQVYLRSTGGEELDQWGYLAWYVNGTYHSTTYTPEFTLVGLEPGTTYTFRTEQVQNDEVVATSDDLTLTLPPAEEFSLSASVRTANAVELSIVNRRFPVVGYYRILRDGLQIGQLFGEALGDFGLAYATTYTYQVVALTSSNLELGRSNTVSITTGTQPAVPPPAEAIPSSIQFSVDSIELRASERAQASAQVLDQYGRPMLGHPVYFISADSSIASIDADWGSIIADREGRVDLHAELVADRNLWSPLLTLIVHRSDWTPPVPPAWHVIGVSEPLQLDSRGYHWSDPSHEAWVGGDSTTWVTLPHTFPRLYQLWMTQYFNGGVFPLDGFTWYPADGRLGVYFQTIHGCELWVNGIRVGAWGNPYGYGTQPINLPELGNSLSVPHVEITPYLKEGLNHLVLYVSSGFGWPELRHLEFVNLNGAPVQTVALPNLAGRLQAAGEFTAEDPAKVTVVVENPSPTACNASTLALSVDGVAVQTYRVPELAANASHRFDAILGQLPSGVHTVAIVADSDQQIAESDESNTAELALTVLPVRRADLAVSVSLPASGFIGEFLPVTVAVDNRGDAASPPCQLQCGYGGTTPWSIEDSECGELVFIVPELAPGEEAAFATSLRLAELGTFTFWADVDAGGEVRESDEANNLASAVLPIVPRPSNLAVWTITLTPVTPIITDLARLRVIVVNNGQTASPACQLSGTVSLGQSPWGDLPVATIPALARYASTTLDVAAGPFPVAGTYAVAFTADSTNLVSESQEDDNQKSISFTVIAFPPLASFPPPQYAFSRTEDYTTWAGEYTRYQFTCLNWSDYPDVIFRSEPTVVCGTPGASRTWVSLWAVNAAGGKSYLYGFCGFSSAANLNSVWFGLPRGSLPPAQVCVTLTDEVVGTVLTSNLVAIPRPSVVLFSDNLEAGLTKWRLNAGASGSTPVVGRRSYPYGGKLASNGAYVMYLGDSTAGTYATATAEFTVNLTGYTSAVLEFDWSTYSLASPEGVFVDVFDGTWRTGVAVNRSSGWRHVTLDLSAYQKSSAFTVRFRSYQDWPESSDAAYVDNVKLTAK